MGIQYSVHCRSRMTERKLSVASAAALAEVILEDLQLQKSKLKTSCIKTCMPTSAEFGTQDDMHGDERECVRAGELEADCGIDCDRVWLQWRNVVPCQT